jgi:hypothetical protein
MNRNLGTLFVVVGGIASGLFGSLIGNRVQRSSDQAARPASEARPGAGAVASGWMQGVGSPDREPARLPREPAVPADPDAREAKRSEAAAAEAELRALVLDPELARAAALERWTAALSKHEAELSDPAWSASTGHAFESDLRGLSTENGFRLLTSQCRTTTCSARLEWPDYKSALQGAQKLVHHVYRTNCGTETALPEPPSGRENDPYQVTLLYDCAWLRAGG